MALLVYFYLAKEGDITILKEGVKILKEGVKILKGGVTVSNPLIYSLLFERRGKGFFRYAPKSSSRIGSEKALS